MEKLIALTLALVLLLCCLVGCAKEVNTITDFSKFEGMTKDGTDKIEVTFDNYSGYPFYFTIEDKDDIDEIMEIILYRRNNGDYILGIVQQNGKRSARW